MGAGSWHNLDATQHAAASGPPLDPGAEVRSRGAAEPKKSKKKADDDDDDDEEMSAKDREREEQQAISDLAHMCRVPYSDIAALDESKRTELRRRAAFDLV